MRRASFWGDPKRLVEAKPANVMAKDVKCLEAPLAVDVEQNDAARATEGCNCNNRIYLAI